MLGAFFSLITLIVMQIFLKETLPASERDTEMHINMKDFHIVKLARKWMSIETIRYSITMKMILMLAFMSYTTISALYLVDVFGLTEKQVGFYLIFTGSFLIFNQSVAVRFIVERLRDRKSLLLGMLLVGIGFIAMGLSPNLIFFTSFYYIAVLGISLCMSTT